MMRTVGYAGLLSMVAARTVSKTLDMSLWAESSKILVAPSKGLTVGETEQLQTLQHKGVIRNSDGYGQGWPEPMWHPRRDFSGALLHLQFTYVSKRS